MSNDIAYPVFRTPDLGLALSTVRRLTEFGRREYSEVSVSAELCSVAEVRRVAEDLPGGWFRGQAEYGEFDGVPFQEQPVLVFGAQAPGLPAEPSAYEGRLPVECSLLDQPVGSIEDAFSATIGPNIGAVRWTSLCWPDVPAAEFVGESEHTAVTLLLNSRTRHLDQSAEDHTVLGHIRSAVFNGRQTQEPYAHWLAAQVGLTIIGPGQRL
ncbi:hypothetical protein ACFYM0_03215 [Streptomyces sp. NPDC006487]|uniref:hypothetical protein n=1 Tax=Streptomyces sp. NPDC006487 TaxID=3364748 RepID=UPI0036BF7D67